MYQWNCSKNTVYTTRMCWYLHFHLLFLCCAFIYRLNWEHQFTNVWLFLNFQDPMPVVRTSPKTTPNMACAPPPHLISSWLCVFSLLTCLSLRVERNRTELFSLIPLTKMNHINPKWWSKSKHYNFESINNYKLSTFDQPPVCFEDEHCISCVVKQSDMSLAMWWCAYFRKWFCLVLLLAAQVDGKSQTVVAHNFYRKSVRKKEKMTNGY